MATKVWVLIITVWYALLIQDLRHRIAKLEPSGIIASQSNNKIVIHDMSELPAKPKDTLPCTWKNKPHRLYPTFWVCLKNDEEVGTVWKADFNVSFSAFVGQAYCRSGDFATLQAAKQCVEEELKR